jgi:hypothetical protein
MQRLQATYRNAKITLMAAKQWLDVCAAELQAACKHPIEALRETAWERTEADNTPSAPLRICLHCGLSECGWGWHFNTLGPNYYAMLPTVSVVELYNQRIGPTVLE